MPNILDCIKDPIVPWASLFAITLAMFACETIYWKPACLRRNAWFEIQLIWLVTSKLLQCTASKNKYLGPLFFDLSSKEFLERGREGTARAGDGQWASNSCVESICRSVLTLHSYKKKWAELNWHGGGGELPARLMKLQLHGGFLGRVLLSTPLAG